MTPFKDRNISFKMSFVIGILVLTLLFVAGGIFFKVQKDLIASINREETQRIKDAIEARKRDQLSTLKASIEAHAFVLSDIVANYLYDDDTFSLETILPRYIHRILEIEAVHLLKLREFRITEASLATLKSKKLPEKTLSALYQIKGRLFSLGEKDFIQHLEKTIGKSDTKAFGSLIAEIAEEKIAYKLTTEVFQDHVIRKTLSDTEIKILAKPLPGDIYLPEFPDKAHFEKFLHERLGTRRANEIKSLLLKKMAYNPSYIASWKRGGDVSFGISLPDEIDLSEYKQSTYPIQYESFFVGRIRLYYSDVQVLKKIELAQASIFNNLNQSVINRNNKLFRATVSQGMTMSFIVLALIISSFVSMRSIVIKPLSDVVDGVQHIIERKDLNLKIKARSRDEIGRLASSFNYMVTALKDSMEDMKIAEEKYRSIFENAVEGIFQSTPGAKGQFIKANPAHARIMGYDSPEQMIAEVEDIGSHFWIRPQHRKAFSEQVAKGAVTDFKAQVRRRDGRLVWVSLNARPVFDASGEMEYIEGIMLDITDRKRVENELEEHRQHLEKLVEERTAELTVAKEEAEAANATKSDFLARMSHEIRTPLNAVTGLTHIVLKSDLTDEQREYLHKVQTASNNLLGVINDILDFSKVEAGRMELTHAPFDLDQLLEQLADLFSDRMAQKDLELIFPIAPRVPRQLIGDAGRLTQVLTNLVSNAVKFTETGEIVVAVELGEPVIGDQVIGDRVISGSIKDEGRGTRNDQRVSQKVLKFSVSDTGTGIAADVLPTLFDPFTQAEGYLTRQYEGTGLGLAICRRLVELMGGTIGVQSTQGQGSTFSFTVMLETIKEAKPALDLPAYFHGLKTLLVDDSELARHALVDRLASFSLNVVAVDSGEKAIEALQKADQGEPYQLVLLDWKMPGMDGIETAKRIRQLEHKEPETRKQKPDTPIVILVTAYGYQRVQAHKEAAALNALLLKPVKSSHLCNAIIDLLGRAEDVEVCRVHEPVAQSDQRLFGRRVLVVEDSELNRDVAVALLGEVGLTVDVAENGKVAVDKIFESPRGYYDAVLMDIQMPVMDGYEATSKIRAFERQQNATSEQTEKKTPIIALTAHALKGEKEKCLAADMDDYLAKPLDERDLHRVLLKWIAPQPEEADSPKRS